MMASEVVELQRNPQISSLTELEEKFKKIFNVSKVIWLKKGLADDNQTFVGKFPDGSFPSAGTGGHIDEVSKITCYGTLLIITLKYARFVGPNTILLAQISESDRDSNEISALSYKNLEENLAILSNATTVDGNPFEIVRIPTPPPIVVDVNPGIV